MYWYLLLALVAHYTWYRPNKSTKSYVILSIHPNSILHLFLASIVKPNIWGVSLFFQNYFLERKIKAKGIEHFRLFNIHNNLTFEDCQKNSCCKID